MNLTFAYPWVLALLILVPLLAAVCFVPAIKRRFTGTFQFSRAADLSEVRSGWKRYLEPVPDVLFLVALTLLIVALARPQAIEADEAEVEGIDIYLALDMSGSMRAIDEDKATVEEKVRSGGELEDRFGAAVRVFEEFVESRKYDRLGMVVFAKDAFLQFPLTLDYNTILEMLDRLELGDIDPGGTAIGNALGRAVAGLEESEAESKVVILITDGDRRGGNVSPRKAARIASEMGIKVYPILVGRDGQTLVPVESRGLRGKSTRYREMEFPIDPELLDEIAEETGGESYRATDADDLRQRLHSILDDFERTRLEDASDVDKKELFRGFAVWGAVLLTLQLVLRFAVIRKFP